MRLPRVRFTVRRMMVAVAIFALLLGGVAIQRRRAHFQELADHHAETVRQIRGTSVSMILPDGAYVHGNAADPRITDYYEAMASKYERAARYPWLPVSPDPPPP